MNAALQRRTAQRLASCLLAVIGLSSLGVAAQGPDIEPAIRQAAAEFKVPAQLLIALVYAESRFSVMSLGPDQRRGWVRLTLKKPFRSAARASEILKISPLLILSEPVIGLRATAALLSEMADGSKLQPRNKLENWKAVLEEFNGSPDPLANAFYSTQILELAERGLPSVQKGPGPVEEDPRAPASRLVAQVLGEPPVENSGRTLGAPFAVLVESAPNTHLKASRLCRPVRYVVLHVAEHSFSTIVEYFRRSETNVGAHYLIRAADGLTLQFVDERDVAFHAACFNEESVGIEVEGYTASGKRWFSDSMYRAAALLVRDITERWGIPQDRGHIIGHVETPGCSDHLDPGPDWDWDRLMTLVRDPQQCLPTRDAGGQ